MVGNDAALREMASPRFSKIRSNGECPSTMACSGNAAAPDLKPPRPAQRAQRGEVAERSEADEGQPVSHVKDRGLPGGGTVMQSARAVRGK